LKARLVILEERMISDGLIVQGLKVDEVDDKAWTE
jgi:hypothetical protein